MTSAPGSWSPPGLQGLNARGALKVQRKNAHSANRSEVFPTVSSCCSLVPPVVADPSPLVCPLLAGTPTRLLR
jgi:hypothetical protein